MTADQFCYWLQGFFELKKTIDHRDGATPETMKMIEDHLQTVFKKVTPAFEQKHGLPEMTIPANEEGLKRLSDLLSSQYPWPKEGVQLIC